MNGLRGDMGNKGVTGSDGIKGPPGDNTECIIGERAQNLIGMYTHAYVYVYKYKIL